MVQKSGSVLGQKVVSAGQTVSRFRLIPGSAFWDAFAKGGGGRCRPKCRESRAGRCLRGGPAAFGCTRDRRHEKVLPNADARGRMETAGRITHSADGGVAAGVRAVFRYGGRRCRAAAIPTPGRSVEFPAPWVEWLEEYAMNGRKITGKGLYSG